MEFENKMQEKKFEPCWGLIFSYCVRGGVFGHSCVSLNAKKDINNKPEVTTTILNEINDHIYKTFKYEDIVILNFQIIWISEPLK